MSDNILKNIKSSRNISIGAYLFGAVCFFVAYIMSYKIWFLIAAIVLFVASVSFLFLFKWIEKRLLNKKGSQDG